MKVRVTATMFGTDTSTSRIETANGNRTLGAMDVLEALEIVQVFVENGITCTVSPIEE